MREIAYWLVEGPGGFSQWHTPVEGDCEHGDALTADKVEDTPLAIVVAARKARSGERVYARALRPGAVCLQDYPPHRDVPKAGGG